MIIEKFIPDFKPDYVDLLGDLTDFWQISKFRKNPARKGNLQDDLDTTKEYLQKVREYAPNAEIVLHYGNHMCRLKKYVWDNAKEIDDLRFIDLKVLLEIDKLNIKIIDSEQGFDIRGKLVLTHGTLVSQDSGQTARRNLRKYGQSVICGHTHRLGSTYKTDLRGTIGAWENGCLCNLSLIHEWGAELADWEQGFSTVTYLKDMFLVQQYPIIKGKFIYGEKVYDYNNTENNVVH